MNCEEAIQLHYLVESSEADEAQQRELAAHLESCAQCRGEIESATQTLQAYRVNRKAEALPVGTRADILRKSHAPHRKIVRLVAPLLAAAAAVVLAVIIPNPATHGNNTTPAPMEITIPEMDDTDANEVAAAGLDLDEAEAILGLIAPVATSTPAINNTQPKNEVPVETILKLGDEFSAEFDQLSISSLDA